MFENYPVDAAGFAAAEAAGLRLAGVSGHDATHYPLTLLARPPSHAGGGLALRLDYRPDLFDRARSWGWASG